MSRTPQRNVLSAGSRSPYAGRGARGLFVGRFRLFLWLGVAAATVAVASAQGGQSEQEKLLKRYATQSLYRLKYAIKNDGFYNARVALNVWQSNAIEAGTYDEAQYNAFKKEIYIKSMKDNLKWFDIFISQKDYTDARTCLRFWRVHAEEIGAFDQALYDEMQKKLQK